jgi:hypothetical protein
LPCLPGHYAPLPPSEKALRINIRHPSSPAPRQSGRAALFRPQPCPPGLGAGNLDFETIDADSTTGGNQAFTFVAAPTTTFSGTAGEQIWSQEDLSGTADDKTIVSGDVDGDGVADFQIELTGLVNLTASDFIL